MNISFFAPKAPEATIKQYLAKFDDDTYAEDTWETSYEKGAGTVAQVIFKDETGYYIHFPDKEVNIRNDRAEIFFGLLGVDTIFMGSWDVSDLPLVRRLLVFAKNVCLPKILRSAANDDRYQEIVLVADDVNGYIDRLFDLIVYAMEHDSPVVWC